MKYIKNSVITAVIASFFLLSACNQGPKQTFGGIAGGVGGGLLGSTVGKGKGRLVAVGAGVLLGSLLGSEIGRQMDENDRRLASNAGQRAYSAPVGQDITWNNPRSGNHGAVTPVRDGYSRSGEYCREFQQTVTVGGKTQKAYGTACRQPDGEWKIVN